MDLHKISNSSFTRVNLGRLAFLTFSSNLIWLTQNSKWYSKSLQITGDAKTVLISKQIVPTTHVYYLFHSLKGQFGKGFPDGSVVFVQVNLTKNLQKVGFAHLVEIINNNDCQRYRWSLQTTQVIILTFKQFAFLLPRN